MKENVIIGNKDNTQNQINKSHKTFKISVFHTSV